MYLFRVPIASLSGARNPHVLCVRSGFCAPFALHLNRSWQYIEVPIIHQKNKKRERVWEGATCEVGKK